MLRLPDTDYAEERATFHDAATLESFLAFGAVESAREECVIKRIRPGALAIRGFGYSSPDRIQLCSDLIAWLFLFDDRFADGKFRYDPRELALIHERINPLLQLEPVTLQDPFEGYLADLFYRLGEVAPRCWLRRFGEDIRRYFHGCEREVMLRTAGQKPTLAQYLDVRINSVGVYPMIDCVELAQNSFLSDDLVRRPEVVDGRMHATTWTALMNDYYSAQKEVEENESFNAANVLAREQNLSSEKALQAVQQVQQGCMDAFVRVEQRIYSNAPEPELKDFLIGIWMWMEGCRRWHRECPRYNVLIPNKDFSGSAAAMKKECKPVKAVELLERI